MLLMTTLWFAQGPIFDIFTKKEDLRELRKKVYYGFFLMTAFDFWQVILAGTFRSLEKVELFSKFNFVTYFVIILPVSWILALSVGTHTDSVTGKTVSGQGQMGTWYAFMIGLSFQLTMEIVLLKFYINWDEIAFETCKQMGALGLEAEESMNAKLLL